MEKLSVIPLPAGSTIIIVKIKGSTRKAYLSPGEEVTDYLQEPIVVGHHVKVQRGDSSLCITSRVKSIYKKDDGVYLIKTRRNLFQHSLYELREDVEQSIVHKIIG